MQSLEVSPATVGPRSDTPSILDACKRLWHILAGGFAVIVLLLLKVATTNPASPAPAPPPAPTPAPSPTDNKWTFNAEVATSELLKLDQQYAEYKSWSEEPPWWQHGLEDQKYDSKANADVEGHDIANYKGPTVYKYKDYYNKESDPVPSFLPYPDVIDNTESIAGFEDILELIPENALVVDIGGGKYDSAAKWVQEKRSTVTMLVADPFNRKMDDNEKVQAEVATRCGADVVTSMSVLNVISDVLSQTWHVWLVHHILKPGHLAIFKFYAGLWPVRGTRNQTISAPLVDPTASNTQAQNNAFADAYEPLIAKVFGASNVFADSNKNLIVARKSESSKQPLCQQTQDLLI